MTGIYHGLIPAFIFYISVMLHTILSSRFFASLSAAVLLFSCSACSDDDDELNADSVDYETTAVDLGLPSGVKWANRNVGASSSEQFGTFFAWAETVTKTDFKLANYKFYKNSDYVKTLPSTIEATEYDAAHTTWGESWRLPLKSEYKELLTYATWTWTSQNGVQGYKVTGPNGNSIFFPANGCLSGSEAINQGSRGSYWTAGSVSPIVTDNVTILQFTADGAVLDFNSRYVGRNIRAVSE